MGSGQIGPAKHPAVCAMLVLHGRCLRRERLWRLLVAGALAVAAADVAGVAVVAGGVGGVGGVGWRLCGAVGLFVFFPVLVICLRRPAVTLAQRGAWIDRVAGLPGIGVTLAFLAGGHSGRTDRSNGPCAMVEEFLRGCDERLLVVFRTLPPPARPWRLLLVAPAILLLEFLVGLAITPAGNPESSQLLLRPGEHGTTAQTAQNEGGAAGMDSLDRPPASPQEQQERARRLVELMQQQGAERGAGAGVGSGTTPAGVVPLEMRYQEPPGYLELYRNRATDRSVAVPPEYAGVVAGYLQALAAEAIRSGTSH